VSHARLTLLLCCALAGCSSASGSSGVGLLRGGAGSRWIPGLHKSESVAASNPSEPEVKQAGAAEGASTSSVQSVALANPIEQEPGDAASPDSPVGEVAESIVARVNGDVILAQDLFTPLRGQLVEAQQKVPPQEFPAVRDRIIQQKLRDLIERQLLIQEAKKQLPEALVKRLELDADKDFGKRIESGMKSMGVATESELRRKLLETGESLDQIQAYQRGTNLAQQFIHKQLQSRLSVSREEMLDYYEHHLDDFRAEGGVRWSEIVVSYEKHGSVEAARAKADQMVAQLRAGADFAELAKAQSDGATAPQGGDWDRTAQGSYLVSAVDEALFRLPIGQIGDPIEGPRGWHIVRVNDRITDGVKSFVDAQEEIRGVIRNEKVKHETQAYVSELTSKAHITTVFDKPAAAGQAAAPPDPSEKSPNGL
jgi:parvulin-like peptidyl-prolyl isomerase